MISTPLFSQKEKKMIFKKVTLINNVYIFDGIKEDIKKRNIMIVDNIIKKISDKKIKIPNDSLVIEKDGVTEVFETVNSIDGKGKFLMPGLIDVHAHLLFESVNYDQVLLSDYTMLNFIAAKAAEKQLLRGFTTVRDLGGGALTLAKAIEKGLVIGPRVYASGAFISQTGGHGDFGLPTDVPRRVGDLSYPERNGITAIADGVDQVLTRTREQLRQGATQIKLMAGGGVSSNYDPLDVTQYTDAEFKAAVSAAENWDTYVTVHAYGARPIQKAIKAGVKCIEHGQLIDEATAELMAKECIWWSLQPFLDDEFANPKKGENREKQKAVSKGTDNAYKLAKKYNIKTAWGTDILFSPEMAINQGCQLAKMNKWYTPFEILRMATSNNAELLRMSGKRDPFQKNGHKLGEITEGALADLIIVDENPLKNIYLIEDPEENFLLIMKDGIIYKNVLRK